MKTGNKYEKGKKRTNKQNKSITSSIFHLLGCHGNASSILKYRFNRDAVPLEPMRKHVQHHCEISRTDSNVSSLLTSFLSFFRTQLLEIESFTKIPTIDSTLVDASTVLDDRSMLWQLGGLYRSSSGGERVSQTVGPESVHGVVKMGKDVS